MHYHYLQSAVSDILSSKLTVTSSLGPVICIIKSKTNFLETPQNLRNENILQKLNFKAAMGIFPKRQLLTRLDSEILRLYYHTSK